jgi:hypothetical protein
MWEHLPFVLNCSSAVSLVFLNKHLMKECAFHFLGLLAAMHMGVTSVLAVQQTQLSGKVCQLQHSEVAFFLVVTLVSLVSMNLSLLVNHVGVYQISKIAMIPMCCLLEYLSQGKRITLKAAAAIAVLIAGVLTACVARFVHACCALCLPPRSRLPRATPQHDIGRVAVVAGLRGCACGRIVVVGTQRRVCRPDQEV